MSVFQKDISALKKSIEFFTSLKAERKAMIVANLSTIQLSKEELEKLMPLFEAIQNDISNHDETSISNKLFELGMEKTYSLLFVKNIIEQAPTLEYRINLIAKMTDEDFKNKIPSIANEIWVENKEFEEVTKSHSITNQQLSATVDVFRTFMNGLSRGQYSEKQISDKCTKNGFSNEKVEVLLNALKTRSGFWRDMVNFSNNQDNFFELQKISAQNEEILKILREMLIIFRKNQAGTDQTHFQ